MATSDRCVIAGHIGNETGITYELAQSILRCVNVACVCAKFVPGILKEGVTE
jgi:hypothetical protein